QVAGLVDREQVAGAAPVTVERLPALLAVAEVALRDAVALDPQHADLAARQLGTAGRLGVLGEDLELVALDDAAERARLHVTGPIRAVDVEHLGGADAVVDLAPEPLDEPAEQRLGQRLARR